MGFIEDPTLFDDKIASRQLPQGADPRGVPRAADLNALKDAALDLRTEALAQAEDISNLTFGAPSANTTLVTATGSTTARNLGARFAEVANVRDFGAAGDGSTDDTLAIRAAIAAASRAQIASASGTNWENFGSGGTVFLPRGVYRVTGTLAIQTDGITFCGESAAATVIKMDANGTTDILKIGPSRSFGGVDHSGRMSKIERLGFYSDSTTTSRDAIVIDDTSWWRIEDVKVWKAGRYGLKVGGTLHGTVINFRPWYCGADGVFIDESDATSTEETTTNFYHLYSAYNQGWGVRVRRGHVVSFYSPIVEFNGRGGDADEGGGFKIGDQSSGGRADALIFCPYFEQNPGWDIWAGDVDAATKSCQVQLFGGFADSNGKSSPYGFLRLDYARATGTQPWYSGSGADPATGWPQILVNKYATDSRGAGGADQTDLNGGDLRGAAQPVYYLDGVAQNVNSFNGAIQGCTTTKELQYFGRQTIRIGGPGSGRTVRLHREIAAPTDPNWGTWDAGDLTFNYATGITAASSVFVFRNRVGGSPGTWDPLYCRTTEELRGTSTWDPGSVANGAMTSTTVTVTGAVVGGLASAGFSQALPAGCLLAAAVTAADTVTVSLVNHSGSPVDLASGTLTVAVF